jgi:hypothetical protein
LHQDLVDVLLAKAGGGLLGGLILWVEKLAS